jgi:hypothetical protein
MGSTERPLLFERSYKVTRAIDSGAANHLRAPPYRYVCRLSCGVDLNQPCAYCAFLEITEPIMRPAAGGFGNPMNSLAISCEGRRKPRALLWFLPTTIRKAAIAGLCGSVTHSLLMFAKAELGILDSFQPYQSLQMALIDWTGNYVPPAVPWLISYLNGSTQAIASGFGARIDRIDTISAIDGVLGQAIAHRGPSFLIVDREP